MLDSAILSVTKVAQEVFETGAVSKETAVKAVKDAYLASNPDIPYIPEPYETLLENILLDTVLPLIVEKLWK